MTDHIRTDLCVIGAGSGGLSVAAGASQMGASTVLIEKDRMGGECLNSGCVPSKALLACAHAAEAVRRGPRFGVEADEPVIDSTKVYGHIRDTIAAIAPQDSEERFAGLGVRVIRAPARFVDRRTVEADGFRVTARRFVIATGSSPVVPPIRDLDRVPHHTNETIFELGVLPRHLIIVGGGPIGVEMAQAHRRLGSRVTLLERASIMPRDDPELVEVLRRRLVDDGIDLREGVEVAAVEPMNEGVKVDVEGDDQNAWVEGSHILVATGRRPTIKGLNLEDAGVEYGPRGITVDARLRTTNRRIFAIGDVIGGYQFTHMAGHQAGIVIRNALFRLPARVETRVVPWVTYTDPELAQVGLTEAEARQQGVDIEKILRWPFAENDRARAEASVEGLVKVLASRRGHVLGAGIVGAGAGELIQTWTLAMKARLKLGTIAGTITPYPTMGEVSTRAAGSFFTPALFGERTKRLVGLLRRLG